MSAITFGATGLQFGLTDETGIAIMSLTRGAEAGEKEVAGSQGDIIGHGAYGFKANYRISGTSLGGNWGANATGIMSAGVGTEYALANASNANGVSGGHIIVKSTELSGDHEDFQKFTASLTQYPSI